MQKSRLLLVSYASSERGLLLRPRLDSLGQLCLWEKTENPDMR